MGWSDSFDWWCMYCAVNSVVPVGKPANREAANGSWPWKSTPFDSTVMPAPSRAPSQRRLLQQLGQVAVQVGIPTHCRFQRQPVDLRTRRGARGADGRGEVVPGIAVGARAAVATGRVERMSAGDGRTVERQAEQAIDLPAPVIHLAGWVGIGVDDGRGGAHPLETDRFPHDQHFLVDAGRNDDHVARRGGVDRRLDRLPSR